MGLGRGSRGREAYPGLCDNGWVAAAGARGQLWRLESAERRHDESPRSFFIPPRSRRESLQPGEGVKLLFVLEDPRETDAWQVERMWVNIASAAGERYVGRLLNDPVTPHVLAKGSVVEFGPEHVSALAVDESAFGYDPEQTIFVSQAVLDSETRPSELFYEKPDDPRDSGWQAFTGEETQAYLDDPAHCQGTVIGWFAERHPEIESALRNPREGWWTWDENEARYVHRTE
jgi:hypothetical protein